MLRDLSLRDFRCFPALSLDPAPGLNFLIGANGQGKTSLLEAACLLLRLQSPKAAVLAETLRFDQPGFAIDGHWNDRHLRLKFSQGVKSFELDSKIQGRSADYLAVARVIWIGNDDLALVRGTGTGRRRYLDFLAAQVEPAYLRSLRAYERAVRCRNALLKEGRARREIAAFDLPMIESGEVVHAVRARLSRDLAPLVTQAYQQISGGREILHTTYLPGHHGPLAEALAASQEQEIHQRLTVVGPHRDDLKIELDERSAATFASEGQQRSIALALKLGQAEALSQAAGQLPLYLIDDVFGELDGARRNNLMATLPAAAQKLITATSLDWRAPGAEATVFRLADGVIRAG